MVLNKIFKDFIFEHAYADEYINPEDESKIDYWNRAIRFYMNYSSIIKDIWNRNGDFK